MIKFLLGFFSFGWLRGLDFLPPLLIRLFLAPILWVEGTKRLGLFSNPDFEWLNPITWIDNNTYNTGVTSLQNMEGIVGIPLPELMNGVIGGLEVIGAILLLMGFAVRWISIPLMIMVVWLGLASLKVQDTVMNTFAELFMTHGYSTPLSSSAEFAITLFLMLLALFFMGAGRFFSFDWLIYNRYFKKLQRKESATALNDPFDIDKTDTDLHN